jgi:hypothetical protein
VDCALAPAARTTLDRERDRSSSLTHDGRAAVELKPYHL